MNDQKVAHVAIIEDDERALRALSDAVCATPKLKLVATAESLRQAETLFSQALDVVLLDLRLPDGSGLEWLRRSRALDFSPRVIVLSAVSQASVVLQAIELGAAGYLEKEAPPAEIPLLIQTVLAGGAPLSPRIAAHVLARLRESHQSVVRTQASAAAPAAPSLSERESEVLRAIAKGLSFKEVAHLYGISVYTVTDHVKSIYKKLAVNSRGEAVFEARQAGLLREE